MEFHPSQIIWVRIFKSSMMESVFFYTILLCVAINVASLLSSGLHLISSVTKVIIYSFFKLSHSLTLLLIHSFTIITIRAPRRPKKSSCWEKAGIIGHPFTNNYSISGSSLTEENSSFGRHLFPRRVWTSAIIPLISLPSEIFSCCWVM